MNKKLMTKKTKTLNSMTSGLNTLNSHKFSPLNTNGTNDTLTNIFTDTCNNNNKSSFRQAATISLFKGSFILSTFLYAFALTGCGNASQSATNTYTSKTNIVDSVIQEQIAKANGENWTDGTDFGNTSLDNGAGNDSNSNDNFFITSNENQITDVYGNAQDRAEYETDSTEIDITLSADEKYSVLGNSNTDYGANT